MSFLCPTCQSPQMTRATAIVNAGTSVGSTRGIGIGPGGRGSIVPAVVSYRGTTHMQSVLASKLAPPSPPHMASSTSQVWTIVSIVLGLLVLCVSLCVISLNQLSAPSAPLIADLLVPGVFLAPCLIGLILSSIHTARTAPQRKAEYQANLGQWQHAMDNWQQLYYCHSCDNVHLSHKGTSAPLDQMYGMIFNV